MVNIDVHSYIDSEGVWKLDREENWEKRRSIYWEVRTENGCESRIQGAIWYSRSDFK